MVRTHALAAGIVDCGGASLQPPRHIQRRADGDQGDEKIEYQQAGNLFLEFQGEHVGISK